MFFIGPSFEVVFDMMHLHFLAKPLRAFKKGSFSEGRENTQKGVVGKIQNEFWGGMRCLQKRAAIQEKLGMLSNISEFRKLSPSERDELESLRNKSCQLKTELWDYRKREYRLRQERNGKHEVFIREFYVNERKRAFQTKLKLRPVHMSTFQIAECKGEGGCCSRDCGCCLEPRAVLPGEGEIYSHCTSECACCVQYYKAP